MTVKLFSVLMTKFTNRKLIAIVLTLDLINTVANIDSLSLIHAIMRISLVMHGVVLNTIQYMILFIPSN